MDIRVFTNMEQLAPFADDWDRLSAQVPLRSWAWASTWWRHYGPRTAAEQRQTSLCVLGALDDQRRLVGVAPWYLQCSATTGRTLRMLGDGETCSDYLSLLCGSGDEGQFADAVADFLLARPRTVRWDRLELTGIDAEDAAMGRFAAALDARGIAVHRRPGANCWRLALGATVDDYYAVVSRDRRRRLRKMWIDYFESGRAQLHRVRRADELERVMAILVDLHQRRRQSLGEPGNFASLRFREFYRDIVPTMFGQERLHFYWLEVDGSPVAAEYLLAGGGVLYAYQAGVEPAALDIQPGKLLFIGILRQALDEGLRGIDFMRGDEPYKARFGATPRPSLELRVAAPHAVAQIRHGLWLAGSQVKRWIKRRWQAPVGSNSDE